MTAVPDRLRAVGITYRQLDYWSTRGYLMPSGGQGSGYVREWPDSEIRVGIRIVELLAEGYRLDVAARRAREQVAA